VLAYLRVFDEDAKKITMPSYKIFIDPSKEFPIDMTKIIWDEKNSNMWIDKNEHQFTLAYPQDAKGGSLEVIIPKLVEIDEHAVIRFKLADRFGNTWDVLPFRLWQIRRELRPTSDRKKIIADYSDEGDGQ
jgi:hypothetical protein